ncbi:hypothetical protein [Halocola ammonii]
MKKELLDILYNQTLFFSENGKSNIDSPNIMVQETHKSSGKSRKEVIGLFKELTDIGFIEKVPDEEYAYRVREMMSIQEIKKRKLNNT